MCPAPTINVVDDTAVLEIDPGPDFDQEINLYPGSGLAVNEIASPIL